MLNLKGNLLTGNVKGTPISGMIGVSEGSALLPGVYDLTPPVTDPVFGVVITAVPTSVRGARVSQYTFENTMVSSSIKNANEPAGAFIITERSVPGRSGLVMSAGFGNLASVLRASGGAQITII